MIFQRIRNLWRLSDAIIVEQGAKHDSITIQAVEGDGKAEFLGEGTQEEFLEQQREDAGTKPWYDRLKRM